MSKGAQPGHSVSEETRRKISETLTGRKQGPSPLRGRRQPAELVERRAAATRRYDSDVCSIEGCEKPRKARGFCSAHYQRWRVHGDTTTVVKLTGTDHPRWNGDAVHYEGAHKRLQASLATTCLICGTADGRLEAALLHTAPSETLLTSTRGKPYSTNSADYVTLCVTCHRQYDSPLADTRTKIESLQLGAATRSDSST